MERGNYNRRVQRERSRATDEDIQDLIALINRDERVAKVTVFKTRHGRAAVGGPLVAIFRWAAGMLQHRTAR